MNDPRIIPPERLEEIRFRDGRGEVFAPDIPALLAHASAQREALAAQEELLTRIGLALFGVGFDKTGEELVSGVAAQEKKIAELGERIAELEECAQTEKSRAASQFSAAMDVERKDCERALVALAGQHFATPAETYGINTSWAIGDLCRAIKLQGDKIAALTAERDELRRLTTNPILFAPNDRVRSRITRNLGTVTQAGQREGFVHVKFDGADSEICFDTADLEPDWESRVAALTAEVAKRGREIGHLFLHGVDSHVLEDEKRIAALEKQLATFGTITPCPNCDGSGKNAHGDCCRIPGHARQCDCLLCKWKNANYRSEQREIENRLRAERAEKQLGDARATLSQIAESEVMGMRYAKRIAGFALAALSATPPVTGEQGVAGAGNAASLNGNRQPGNAPPPTEARDDWGLGMDLRAAPVGDYRLTATRDRNPVVKESFTTQDIENTGANEPMQILQQLPAVAAPTETPADKQEEKPRRCNSLLCQLVGIHSAECIARYEAECHGTGEKP